MKTKRAKPNNRNLRVCEIVREARHTGHLDAEEFSEGVLGQAKCLAVLQIEMMAELTLAVGELARVTAAAGQDITIRLEQMGER